MTDGRTLGIDWTPGEVPALLGLTAIAIYGCVPETSNQMPAIGVMLAVLFSVELVTRRPAAPVWHLGAAALVLWAGLYGAAGRESAIVGALFAFWPLVLVVLVCHLPGRSRPRPVVRWTIGLIGGVAAVAVARTGALEPTIEPALVAVAMAMPMSLAVALVVVAISPRARRHR
jgi:hypothetical protein